MTKARPDLHDAAWRTSTLSNDDANCVEVAFAGDTIAVRDSKDRDGPVLIFTGAEWGAFVGGAKLGEFDIG